MHERNTPVTFGLRNPQEQHLNQIISLLHKIKYQFEAPGISRAIASGADVWDLAQPGLVQNHPMPNHEDRQPVDETDCRCYLAIYPERSTGTLVEFFGSAEQELGEQGLLNGGFIIWEKGEYSKVEFRN